MFAVKIKGSNRILFVGDELDCNLFIEKNNRRNNLFIVFIGDPDD